MSSWSVKEGNCVAQSCPQAPDSSSLRGRSINAGVGTVVSKHLAATSSAS